MPTPDQVVEDIVRSVDAHLYTLMVDERTRERVKAAITAELSPPAAVFPPEPAPATELASENLLIIEDIRQLRRVLGMSTGPLPYSPRRAFHEAIEAVEELKKRVVQ